MFCPNCGKENSADQKFCRACGLNLEGSARLLVEQLPAAEQTRTLAKRKQRVERLLLTLAGVGFSAFAAFVIYKIITDIILDKGLPLGGIVAVAFVLAIVVAIGLIVYRQFLIEAAGKHGPPPTVPLLTQDSRLTTPDSSVPTTRQLTDPYFEPTPSVTESTTDLLIANTNPEKKEFPGS